MKKSMRCCRCKIVGEESIFYKRGTGRPSSVCKKCQIDLNTLSWIRKKVKAIDYLGGVCAHCGERCHPALFDFHHEDAQAKAFDWTKLRTKSWEKIVVELDKCVLLCCFCHRLHGIRNDLWAEVIGDDFV